jgi:phage terminase small subunit
MTTKGRKPKPTILKLLEGNPGKKPLNMNEPKPEMTAPECPSWLEAEAQEEWHRMSEQLYGMGVLEMNGKYP